jgi:beta-glucosidase
MMNYKRIIATVAVMLVSTTAFGQSGDFTVKGKVVSGGQNLAMATATYTSIAKRLSWDFSLSDGTFGGKSSTALPQSQDARITLFADGPVSVDIFDVNGKKVTTVSGKLDKGTYLFQPFSAKLSPSMYVLKIKSGNTVICQKMLPVRNSKTGFTIALSSSNSPAVLAKKLAAIDTVRVGKTGFTPQFVPITTYTDDIGTVTLTAIDIESQVNALFTQMTTPEKLGQLAMPPNAGGTAANATSAASNRIGCIFGGGGALVNSSATASADYIDGVQRAMIGTPRKIPILAAYDMVHGASAVPGATFFPHNLGMGAIQDTILIQKAFRVTAFEVRGAGLNWGFGPCIAVIRDDRWGRAYEGFCETPERTQIMARHAVLGIQTTDLSLPTAYAACAKHFAGDGNTQNGTNTGTTEGPDATARAINLPGYSSAVKAGVATIMPSFSSWCDGVRMHQNKTLLTGWLKSTAAGNPGFQGFLVGDYEAAWPLPTCVDAGVDVPMAPGCGMGIIATNDPANKNNFTTLYNSGGTYPARIDDAVKRVLRVKYWMNMFDPAQYLTDRRLTSLIGCAEHRAVARACVRASQVLLKNTGNVIPIPKTASVAIIGDAGDNLGLQCGGWTITWQGQAGQMNGVTGTTVRQGVSAVCTGGVTYNQGYTNSTYVLAFLSETPYAETDFPDLSLTGKNSSGSNASVITQIAAAHAAGKKVVCVLMTGRVLDITSVIDNCDAFIWSCWPGTEGNGISDVLFGDYKFTAKLPVTWPMNSAQEPINSGDAKTGRYAYGFGLTD